MATTMQDRLTQKPKTNDSGAVTLKVGQPAVNVKIPEIKVPEIKVPESTVNVDTSGIAQAVASLAQTISQLAQQQNMILREMAETRKLLGEVAKISPNVQVAAPKISMPPRPRSFGVEVEDDDGNMTYMRIVADSPN